MHYRRWRLYGTTGPAGTRYGKGTFTASGYRIISVSGKQRFEHRIIMEQLLGRQLLRKEEVHHRDGCPWNNEPSNLQLVTSGEHHRIHCGPMWTASGRNCASCGKYLPLTSFYRYLKTGKPTSYCKECHSLKQLTSRLKRGTASLTCLDCGIALTGIRLRCNSCNARRRRPAKPPRTCVDCGVAVSTRSSARCRSCGRIELLRRRPDLVPLHRGGRFVSRKAPA